MNCRKKMLLSWKVENIPDELSGLDKEIARKTIKGAPWFLLAAQYKKKEKDHLNERLLNEKEP